MSARFGLSPKTIEVIGEVFSRHRDIERAILFGSRAKGTHKPGSDIDLVLCGSRLSQRTLNLVYGELDDLPIPHGFSLVLDSKLTDPEVRAHVDRVGVVFYERRPETVKA